jgi:hypothetical protein
MLCPCCGARTQVNEKRGPFRDRRCTNAVCGLNFTTREEMMTQRERSRFCAKTRLTKIETPETLAPPGAKRSRSSNRVLRVPSASVESATGDPGGPVPPCSQAAT